MFHGRCSQQLHYTSLVGTNRNRYQLTGAPDSLQYVQYFDETWIHLLVGSRGTSRIHNSRHFESDPSFGHVRPTKI